jgi:hypothetical protein
MRTLWGFIKCTLIIYKSYLIILYYKFPIILEQAVLVNIDSSAEADSTLY